MPPPDRRPGIRNRIASAHETLQDTLTKPTDEQIVDRFSQLGINDVVSVPCSITASMQDMWQERADKGEMDLLMTTHEHNLVGLAAGEYFGKGKVRLIQMQNSGLPNAGDGIISFAEVYEIPTLLLVTWRGSTGKDDSEPHQAIGKRTDKLSRVIVGEDVHGTRMGRGILQAIDKAVSDVSEGGVA